MHCPNYLTILLFTLFYMLYNRQVLTLVLIEIKFSRLFEQILQILNCGFLVPVSPENIFELKTLVKICFLNPLTSFVKFDWILLTHMFSFSNFCHTEDCNYNSGWKTKTPSHWKIYYLCVSGKCESELLYERKWARNAGVLKEVLNHIECEWFWHRRGQKQN